MNYSSFIEYFNENDCFGKNNGIRLTEVREGFAAAEMEVLPAYCNFMGTLHGGAYYSLADVVAGTSLISYGRLCVTLNASIQYIRPVSKGKIFAAARVIQFGGKIGVAEVDITDGSGELLSRCTVTMYLTNKPVPGFKHPDKTAGQDVK